MLQEFKDLLLLLWQEHKISRCGTSAAGHNQAACELCQRVLAMLESFK
jgi:hypothetical protein